MAWVEPSVAPPSASRSRCQPRSPAGTVSAASCRCGPSRTGRRARGSRLEAVRGSCSTVCGVSSYCTDRGDSEIDANRRPPPRRDPGTRPRRGVDDIDAVRAPLPDRCVPLDRVPGILDKARSVRRIAPRRSSARAAQRRRQCRRPPSLGHRVRIMIRNSAPYGRGRPRLSVMARSDTFLGRVLQADCRPAQPGDRGERWDTADPAHHGLRFRRLATWPNRRRTTRRGRGSAVPTPPALPAVVDSLLSAIR